MAYRYEILAGSLSKKTKGLLPRLLFFLLFHVVCDFVNMLGTRATARVKVRKRKFKVRESAPACLSHLHNLAGHLVGPVYRASADVGSADQTPDRHWLDFFSLAHRGFPSCQPIASHAPAAPVLSNTWYRPTTGTSRPSYAADCTPGLGKVRLRLSDCVFSRQWPGVSEEYAACSGFAMDASLVACPLCRT